VEDLDPNWLFEFTGLDLKSEGDTIKLRNEEVSSYKTLDEIREEANLKPVGKERGGDVVYNPQYIQLVLQGLLQGTGTQPSTQPPAAPATPSTGATPKKTTGLLFE